VLFDILLVGRPDNRTDRTDCGVPPKYIPSKKWNTHGG